MDFSKCVMSVRGGSLCRDKKKTDRGRRSESVPGVSDKSVRFTSTSHQLHINADDTQTIRNQER